MDLTKLHEPFPADCVSWRVGSVSAEKKKGKALAYIDARDVMQRLDEIVGPENWQCRYTHAESKTVCEIGIKIGNEWVWKSNGAGDTDFEQEKGALSDAFKRAAVLWGIGRYLYGIDAPWVDVEPAGKSWKIPNHELLKLNKLLGSKPKSTVGREVHAPSFAEMKSALDRIASRLEDVFSLGELASYRKAVIAKMDQENWPAEGVEDDMSHRHVALQMIADREREIQNRMMPNLLMAGQ